MHRVIAAFVVVGLVASVSARQVAGEDAALAAIRAEGLERSQVMDTLFWLTDRHGPRLTGSPGFEEAGDFVVARLESWGTANVRRERFPYGTGWELVRFSAQMVEPRVMPIIGMPKAWTPGTNGPVTADVVLADLRTAADAAALAGTLRGRIVLSQPAREVRMLDGRIVLRMNDKDIEEALAPVSQDEEPETPATPPPADALTRAEIADFFVKEGVAAVIDRGSDAFTVSGGSDLSWQTQRVDGGTVFVGGAPRTVAPEDTVPQITIAVEHYNRMVRLLEHGVPVRMTLDVETKYHPEDPARPNGFNVIADIPGTDKADEVVLIGAHLDSWHGATGATDNATGVAAMMEAMRILKQTGLAPRRTIRIGLWGGEENGLLGSRHYVRTHLGTRQAPQPGLAKHVAYFNIDNGTGRVRGVWMQENDAAMAVFRDWIAPLRDLGVELLSPRRVTSTDHVAFDAVGVPGFQFIQERYEYRSRTHHSTMDFYDRVQEEDLKQIATVAATFAWKAANADEPLPRRNPVYDLR